MMDVKLVSIGALDRRSTIERRLDNLLNRYAKSEFQTFNVVAAYADLLEAYLAVVRRRHKLRRDSKHFRMSSTEEQYLEFITKETQVELMRRVRLAKKHLLSGDKDSATEVLENLERDMPNLSDGDQRNIASATREPGPMQQILTRLVKRINHITESQVIEALRDMRGDGVVMEIDEEYVEINVTPPGGKGLKIKPYRLSGIGASLSRTKKTLKITRV